MKRLAAWSLMLFALNGAIARAEACRWPAQQSLRELPQASGEMIQVREFADDPDLHQPGVPDAKPYREMREWIESKVDPDPWELLRRQREIFASSQLMKGAVPLFDRILSGKLGVISDISCLEALLINEQTALYPIEKTGAEFAALAMRRAGRVRVYFVPGHMRGSGPSMSTLDPAFRQDLKQGWEVLFHLHNHPFSFDNRYRDIAGTTIPSSQDIRLFRDLGKRLRLLEARVTNGISTIRIPASQFDEM